MNRNLYRSCTIIATAVLMFSLGCAPSGTENGAQAAAGTQEQYRLEPEEVLVSVHGNELTYGEAIRQVERRLGGPPPQSMEPARVKQIEQQTFQRVIDDFIRRELLLAEARRLEIEPSPEDVAFAVNTILENSKPGETPPTGMVYEGPDSLQREVYTGLQIEKLLAQELDSSIEPTAAEVQEVFSSQPESPMHPAKARIRQILLEIPLQATEDEIAALRQQAEEARQALVDGADFAEWARMISQGPAAQNGGEVGVVEQGQGEPVLDEAAFSQEIGAIGPVVRSARGFHIVQVLERTPAQPITEKDVRDMLRRRKRTQALHQYVLSLRKKADIKHSPAIRPLPDPTADSTP